MQQNIGDVFHQDVFSFHVIKAQQSQVLVNREEKPSMNFKIDCIFTYEFNVVDQRNIDSFSHVKFLEKTVVALPLIVKVVYNFFVKDFLLHVHQ
jgi:hypothetical protein